MDVKASDLVKKFGIDAIVHDFSGYLAEEKVGLIKFLTHENEYIEVDGDYLKRLVESHELVKSKGGLSQAKEILNSQHNLYTDMKLAQAVSDVESCR